MRSLFIKLNYALWALKKILQPHLGETVTYQGQRCKLIQGACHPYWDLVPISELELNKDKRYILRRIHVADFKLGKSPKRMIWAFKQSYQFKMEYWYRIDMMEKRVFARVKRAG